MEEASTTKDNSISEDVYVNVEGLKKEPTLTRSLQNDKAPTTKGGHTKKSHGWMVPVLVVTLGILFVIVGILTGILFVNYFAMKDELSVLKYNVSDPVLKNDISELWKSVSNIMGDLSKLKDKASTCTTCSPGWKLMNSHCYYVSTSGETWEKSSEICTEHNAILITIKDNVEMLSLFSIIKQERYWIGLKRKPNHIGMWVWTDGSPLTYSAWHEGEPNNDYDNEHCAELMGGPQTWNDLSCDHKLLYICKAVWSC
ncbi:CD209 antigen-like protein C [Rhinoderma darwinii]|uniref:CD209 antigen-like protein C n=1 Tax=Rhinoderma darwinii TaxID=43563 RepID=UPI003F6764F6